METIPNHRIVKLLDNRVEEKPLIEAIIRRDYFASFLEEVEASWKEAREKAAARNQDSGWMPLEHAHWDWRHKAYNVEAGNYLLVGVELEGNIQGLMAVQRLPRQARLCDGYVLYVDYLESAPWNLRSSGEPARFLGVGTVLIAEAVRISVENGFEGRVGLHSLPQAEAFYHKCGLSRIGEDSAYYDLPYFEYSGQQGMFWLHSIGVSL